MPHATITFMSWSRQKLWDSHLSFWLVTRLYRAGVKKLRHWDQSWRGSLQLAALVVCEEFLADRDKLNPSMRPAARIKAPV